jgi:hypothetical protein
MPDPADPAVLESEVALKVGVQRPIHMDVRRLLVCVSLLLCAARAAHADPALAKQRAHRRAVRSAGYLLVGGGVALGAGTLVMAELGKRANDSIQFGGYATAQEIEDRAAQGRKYNLAAWCLAGGGGALFATGLLLVVTHPDPHAPRIEAAPVAGGAVVGISGVLP